jgi:cell division control protein 6
LKKLTFQLFPQFADTVIFGPYSEYELKQILLARVGTSVIDPNVLDYIAKKIAASSGDARKALELAANAVQHRLDQLLSTYGAATGMSNAAVGPIVKMPNVMQASKEEAVNLKERIAGQPVVGKVILCVLTSYAHAGGAVDTTIGELKQCVYECMRQSGMEDEMVQMDDFLVLLETLVDSGLLRASSNTAMKTDSGNGFNLTRRTLSDVHRQPIRLGIQLEDIEKVLESDLKQSFFQNLRERAKNRRHEE